MVTAQRRPLRTSWTATLVTGVASAILGGLFGAPALGAPPADHGAHAAGARPTGPGDVPNPITYLPKDTNASGPLSAADRDLVYKVKLAGSWEGPASDMAIKKGSSKRVREVGAEIGPQHHKLDQMAIAAAARLGVPLPTEPNPEQKGWLAEMERATGPDFDRVFVERLRAAHGKIFPAIATVRASTRNDVVRELAAQANSFVLTHLTLLESTGMVDYQSLPQAPPPAPAAAAAIAADAARNGSLLGGADARTGVGGVSPTVIWIVLAVALIAGAYSLVRLIRSR
jgi:predicted outer membrane protein